MTTSERVLRVLAIIYIAAIPLDEVQIAGVGSASALAGLLLILVWLVTLLHRQQPQPSDFTRWLPAMVLAAMTVMALLSLVWSLDADMTRTTTRSYLGLLLAIPALAAGLRLIGGWAPVAYIVSAVVIALSTFLTYRAEVTQGQLGSRGTAAELNQNQLALMLCVATGWALIHAPRLQGWKRYAMYGAAVIPVLGMLSTGSRTGLIALTLVVLAAPFLTLQMSASHRLRALLIVLVLIAVTVWVAWTFREFFPARLQETADNLRTGDFSGRSQFWEIAFTNSDIWLPLGVGAGASQAFMTLFYLGARSMHNTYIQLGVEMGYVGFVLAVGIFVSIIVASRRSPFRPYVLIGILPFIAYSFSTSLDTFNSLWMLAGFAAVRVPDGDAGFDGQRLAEQRSAPRAISPSHKASRLGSRSGGTRRRSSGRSRQPIDASRMSTSR